MINGQSQLHIFMKIIIVHVTVKIHSASPCAISQLLDCYWYNYFQNVRDDLYKINYGVIIYF